MKPTWLLATLDYCCQEDTAVTMRDCQSERGVCEGSQRLVMTDGHTSVSQSGQVCWPGPLESP